jgi:hypothetical protein
MGQRGEVSQGQLFRCALRRPPPPNLSTCCSARISDARWGEPWWRLGFRKGAGVDASRAYPAPLCVAKQGTVDHRRAPYPPAIRGPPRTAYRVLSTGESTGEVKEMGREKTILPLVGVQNHLPATARNERHGRYE